MTESYVPAYSLTAQQSNEISALLKEAFNTYPDGQTYFRQIPCFHYLLRSGDELVAHASVNHRLINIDGELYRIFGIGDLCVANKKQNQGIGKHLLDQLFKKAKSSDIDFLVLITDQSKFYKKNGFSRIKSRARWVVIGEDRLLGIHERRMDNSLYIKSVKKIKWPKGVVDFLGPLF
jgi:predicted N-acetyltransferase YhbS